MFCKECGKDLSDKARIYPNCCMSLSGNGEYIKD